MHDQQEKIHHTGRNMTNIFILVYFGAALVLKAQYTRARLPARCVVNPVVAPQRGHVQLRLASRLQIAATHRLVSVRLCDLQ